MSSFLSDVDILIRGGRVIDGSGAPARSADVAVRDGRVLAVVPAGQFGGAAAEVIDAGGHIVSPGFVDMHSHSDIAVLAEPTARQKLQQGVTTEVVGNCGISVAPVREQFLEQSRQYALPIVGFGEIDWTWSSVGDYLERVTAAQPAVNVATYAGLGSIRCAVMGFASGSPTRQQQRDMVELVAEALKDGAVGLSSGLVYAPGSYSSHEEICELVEQAGQVGALYSSHMRDQGEGFLLSVAETIDVGRVTGAPVNIAHHKVVGERNWGAVTQSLAMVRQARKDGIDVGSDVYPYLAGATTMTALLPDWALEGGMSAMLTRLNDPLVRARIKDDWTHGRPQWDNRVASLGWGNIYISHLSTADNQRFVGLNVREATARRDAAADPADFLMDLLIEERGAVGNIQMACSEEDLRLVMQEPSTSFGSDGLLVGAKPHPSPVWNLPANTGRVRAGARSTRSRGRDPEDDLAASRAPRACRNRAYRRRVLGRPGDLRCSDDRRPGELRESHRTTHRNPRCARQRTVRRTGWPADLEPFRTGASTQFPTTRRLSARPHHQRSTVSTLNPLERRRLGNTHMSVTRVSLGGAGLGGIFGPVGDDEGVAAVEKALELGMNYLDTSPKYGSAEKRMGLALRGVPRDSYYLSSKVGTHPDKPGDYSAEAAYWTVEQSLDVLGVDYLDLCHIHEPEPEQLSAALASGGALEALVDLKEQGVIRSIGIGVQDHDLHKRAAETGHLDVNMMVNDYTLLRQNVVDIFALADDRGLGLVNGAALAMGLLSGRDPQSIGTDRWTPPAGEVASAERVHRWCAARSIPVLALALQFSVRQEGFDCTLIGAANAAEVAGCWEAVNFEIPQSVWEELPALLDDVRVS